MSKSILARLVGFVVHIDRTFSRRFVVGSLPASKLCVEIPTFKLVEVEVEAGFSWNQIARSFQQWWDWCMELSVGGMVVEWPIHLGNCVSVVQSRPC